MVTNFYDGCIAPCPTQQPTPIYNPCTTEVGEVSAKIKGLVWKTCTSIITDLADLTDQGDWYALLGAGDIVGTPCRKTNGEWKVPTPTKKKRSACCPEEVTEILRGFTFRDWNYDCVNYTNVDFYQDKMCNQQYYELGIITCDDRFYGWIPPCHYSLTYWEDPEQEDDGKLANLIDVDIKLPVCYPWKPVYLPGLCGLLSQAAQGLITGKAA